MLEQHELELAIERIAQRVAQLLQSHAPVDSNGGDDEGQTETIITTKTTRIRGPYSAARAARFVSDDPRLLTFYSNSAHKYTRHGPSNQAMELTASKRNNLPFGSVNPYPVAMHLLARGSSSWSR